MVDGDILVERLGDDADCECVVVAGGMENSNKCKYVLKRNIKI